MTDLDARTLRALAEEIHRSVDSGVQVANNIVRQKVFPEGRCPGLDAARLDSFIENYQKQQAAGIPRNLMSIPADEPTEWRARLLADEFIVCLLCLEDSKIALANGDYEVAMNMAISASESFGRLSGVISSLLGGEQDGDQLRQFALRGADSLHKENRNSKQEIFEWCWKHRHEYRSANAAAEVAKKLVPHTFDTVRDWIREWTRKQQRAEKE